MEHFFSLQELLVFLDLIDYFISDNERRFSPSLGDLVFGRLRSLREKVVSEIHMIDPDFELPY